MILKSQVFNIIADIPVYASVAWLYVAKIIDPTNFPEWEEWLFYHGWLCLLGLRLANAVYDTYRKVIADHTASQRDESGRFTKKQNLSTSEVIKMTIKRLWSKK
jgi:hypothetical protein